MSRRTDPLVRTALREAMIVTLIWLAAAAWSVSVCFRMGYNRDISTLKLVFGFPDWVFWGIVLPWTVCTGLSIVFGLVFVRDGDLGRDIEDADDLGLGG